MLAGIPWLMRSSGLTVDVLKGLCFHECLQEFLSFYARQVSHLMSSKACFFNECLQEVIGYYALQVSLLMS